MKPQRLPQGKPDRLAPLPVRGYKVSTVTADLLRHDPLTGKQRRFLRALAHHLHPVVQIGRGGWAEPIAKELDRALLDHELVKVKVGREAPLKADDVVAELEAATGASVVQIIGRTLVVFRPHPEKPRIMLPSRRPAPS